MFARMLANARRRIQAHPDTPFFKQIAVGVGAANAAAAAAGYASASKTTTTFSELENGISSANDLAASNTPAHKTISTDLVKEETPKRLEKSLYRGTTLTLAINCITLLDPDGMLLYLAAFAGPAMLTGSFQAGRFFAAKQNSMRAASTAESTPKLR